MKALSNKERSAQSDANLERKRARLAELVQMVADGESLGGVAYPTNIEEFRDFEDSERDLRKIGSPKLLNRKYSPTRITLIEEIEGHIAKLAAFKSTVKVRTKKPSLSNQLGRIKAERADLKYLVGRLVSQVASLLDENHKLRAAERAAEKTKNLTSETIKGLNRKVVKLGGSLLGEVKSND
jgi:chromosome segregation ATPase